MTIVPMSEDKASSLFPGQVLLELFRHGLDPRREYTLRAGSLLTMAKCLAQAMRYPHWTREWLAFLKTFARAEDLPPAPLELVLKPLGTYAVHGLSVREHVAMLRGHYLFAARTMPRRLLLSLWADAGVELGYLRGKSGKIYRLKLDPARHCGKEGEYSLVFEDVEDGFVLARLTFLLTPQNGEALEPVALIGGLQGPSTIVGADWKDRKERIVSATRDLSGLRPKMVVFIALSAFAAACGVTSLHAVSNRTHIINADARYQRKRLRADYDGFWIERQGISDGFGFRMPLDLASKSERAAYKQQRASVVTLVDHLFAAS
ncbi:DUF535 family protein [Beijerinckia indica]|uniref:DUF535 domain-containing protein n=1 Tax=Beijerinckia indica subsp. indica (strain ATCC 9039 / DSM 1715 / NCIMB 8712) TaxID=395963 RepID=B2IEC8_BEII9|nr:DUF535 family protein [Beijerinckia indica]ACB95526.1 protein of unknown function DUF535 [Beijerinckia indica subsp. indica ATCC 9039]